MKQVVCLGTKKKELCNNVKRKSNCEELLSVKVSTTEVSSCVKGSAKMNFRLLLKYYNKIKIKYIINVVCNTQIIV